MKPIHKKFRKKNGFVPSVVKNLRVQISFVNIFSISMRKRFLKSKPKLNISTTISEILRGHNYQSTLVIRLLLQEKLIVKLSHHSQQLCKCFFNFTRFWQYSLIKRIFFSSHNEAPDLLVDLEEISVATSAATEVVSEVVLEEEVVVVLEDLEPIAVVSVDGKHKHFISKQYCLNLLPEVKSQYSCT